MILPEKGQVNSLMKSSYSLSDMKESEFDCFPFSSFKSFSSILMRYKSLAFLV